MLTLRLPLTSFRVCIIVSNSPNPSRVYIRLCKHGKRFLLLKRLFTIFESLIIYSVCSQSLHKFLFSKALQEIFSPPNSLCRKGQTVYYGELKSQHLLYLYYRIFIEPKIFSVTGSKSSSSKAEHGITCNRTFYPKYLNEHEEE